MGGDRSAEKTMSAPAAISVDSQRNVDACPSVAADSSSQTPSPRFMNRNQGAQIAEIAKPQTKSPIMSRLKPAELSTRKARAETTSQIPIARLTSGGQRARSMAHLHPHVAHHRSAPLARRAQRRGVHAEEREGVSAA